MMTTVLTDKVVTSRKSHQCWGCGSKYEKGSKMRYNTYANDGSIFATYWCETCDHILQNHNRYWDSEDGIDFGSVKEDDLDLWKNTQQTILNEKVSK